MKLINADKIKNKRMTKNYIQWDNSGKGYGSQQDRAYFIDKKMCTVPAHRGMVKMNIVIDYIRNLFRRIEINEVEKLQTVPIDYTKGVSIEQRCMMLGNGWTVDVIKHIFKGVEVMEKEGLTVLSLFDGISCGHIALDRAGLKVKQYFASEIDKYAIKVTMKNYPETIQVGDITKLKGSDFPHINILMGGSPCQGFSFAGKQLNFKDPRSALFFEFVRLLKECNPDYFLLENVRMKKEYQDVISGELGVEPIEINSALVSAQNRKRLYWTNIPWVTQPADKGIMLKDIIDNEL